MAFEVDASRRGTDACQPVQGDVVEKSVTGDRLKRTVLRVGPLGEFGHTARPAVRQDQRNGVGASGATVQEVNSEAVDGRTELADLVEAVLEGSP